MIRIYVRKRNEKTGHVFKSRWSVQKDRMSLLPFSFVLRGIVPESEYMESTQTIIKRFNLYVSETKIDGRSKLARSIKYFTWGRVLEPSISRRIRI